VQKGVLQQPGQVGGAPPVGVVDDQEQAGRAVGPQVLAAGLDRVGVGAVEGDGDRPAGCGGLVGEPGGEPALPLAARPVQPPDAQPTAAVPPLPQRVELLAPARERDHLTAGVEHPARQPAEPVPVGVRRGPPGAEQVERQPLAAVHVDVGADHPEREAVDRDHVLHVEGLRFVGLAHEPPAPARRARPADDGQSAKP
jgi:hypothetical protein